MIYLDSNATTPLLPEVKEKMQETMDYYGNPSSMHSLGYESNIPIKKAKRDIADYLGCAPDEIIITSGGSESNCQALISLYDYAAVNGLNHIITSRIEHHSILAACEYLAKYRGAKIDYVGVDANGVVNPTDVENAITPCTCLISIMDANNEIGTMQNTYKISEIARSYGIPFHSDCVQSFMHRTIDCRDYDMFSVSAHKFGGPKGTGLLYVKDGTPLLPLIHGTQNNGMRGGTENLCGILGLAKAIEVNANNMYEWNKQIYALANHMKYRIMNEIDGARFNGHPTLRLVNNLNFSFDGIRGEELLMMLDMYGICVSTGSACNSSSGEPSHVLRAIGLSNEQANSSIRISLSHENTIEEIDFAVDRLKDSINMLRERN